MLKRIFVTIISIFVISFAVMAVEPKDMNPQVLRSSQYLVDIVDNVSKYHPEGKNYLKPEYIQGAKTAIIKYLGICDIKKENKEKLINFLKAKNFSTLTQLIYVLEQFSENVEKLNMLEISDIAANGILAVTKDQFCQVMSMEQVQKMQQMMSSGEDKTIGLNLKKSKDGKFHVMFIRWNFLAFYMGFKVGDEVLSINGKKLSEIKRNQELEQLLKAEIGEKIEIVIMREGFEKPITLSGIQQNLTHPDAIGAMLPGKIGYIRTDMFTMSLHTNVKNIIDALLKNEMRGLIIDFRNNPGGAMPAATGLCDYFLEKDKIITITKGSYSNPLGKLAEMFAPAGSTGKKIDAETTHFLAQEDNPLEFPVVMLINKLSASASEMTSGCFKSHKRAVLVGETSFGKGIGQTAIPLTSSPEKSQGGGGMMGMMGGNNKGMRLLYMTVMTYFLPQGEKVHHIGVEPDVPVAFEDKDAKIFDKVAKLRSSGELVKYVQKKRAKMKTKPDFFTKELLKSTKNLMQFPDSGKLVNIMHKYKLKQDTMLRELRLAVLIATQQEFSQPRDLATDAIQQPFYNVTDDNQLQQAIIEMLKLLKD